MEVELGKANEAARTAKEAAKASELASYDLGVQETEVRLAEELAEVCKDYFQEVWAETINLAGVLAASEWRKAKNIYYPAVIREVPNYTPSSHCPYSNLL